MNKKQIKQAQQFNAMRNALIRIYKEYQTPAQLRKDKNTEFLGFEETIEMAYENIQETARAAVKGIRAINLITKVPFEKKEERPLDGTNMMDHGAY